MRMAAEEDWIGSDRRLSAAQFTLLYLMLSVIVFILWIFLAVAVWRQDGHASASFLSRRETKRKKERQANDPSSVLPKPEVGE